MEIHRIRIILSTVLLLFFFAASVPAMVLAVQEETIMGVVIKSGKNYVIEAEDGDYVAKGKDISKLVGKLVLATGIVTESSKGFTIEIKSIEDIQETGED